MKKFPKKQFTLPKEIVAQIDTLSTEGDDLLDTGKYEEAANKYIEAFRLLPDPKEQWDVAFWLIKFWGICYFEAKEYDTAINSFESAVLFKGAENDAEVFLLLGKSYYLNGDTKRAKVNLKKAFEIGGKEAFEGDDKYLSMV